MSSKMMGGQGQSIADRVIAAKHSIAGQGLAKSVCKATTEELLGPKKKHLDYLLQCTNEPNVSIPNLANLLIERTQHHNWIVVFKGLVTIHNLMNYGNERFTQYLASNNCTFQLGSFLDKGGVQGYDMSTFIRRYAKYLNEKAYSYRQMAFDFCKVKRGKDDGLLRTMNGDKLLKTLPVLQNQLDALLEFDCTPNELTNGVINACFMVMFKDLIRLFACYNDGIINLLEKYFEMNKKQCREALDIYKRFLVRMDKVSEFLKVAENVGIDKGDIPDLAKAPSSLLDALEQHLASLEGAKKGTTVTAPRPAGVTSAINSFASASASANATVTEEEKRRILEDENRRLEQLKEQRMLEQQQSPPSQMSTNPFSTSQAPTTQTTSPSQSVDLFGGSAATQSSVRPSDDLLGLGGPTSNPFNQNAMAAQPSQNLFGDTSAGWGGPAPAATGASGPSVVNNSTNVQGNFASDAEFTAVFGNSSNQQQSGFDGFGEVMKPIGSQAQTTATQKQDNLIKGDLDTSLALLAGNLNINGPGYQVKKPGHQWTGGGEKKLTGGANWSGQPLSSSTTAPQATTYPPMGGSTFQQGMGGGMMGYQQPGMMGSGFQQQPMGMPQQRPMGMGMGMGAQQPGFGMQPSAMGQPRPMGQQQNPNDPFGSL